VALVAESRHECVDRVLEKWLASGYLDKWAGCRFRASDAFIDGQDVPFEKGILRIAPGATEVAGCKPDEEAGASGMRGLSLYAEKKLVDQQLSRSKATQGVWEQCSFHG
jgi:hypothetical protein